MDKMVPLYHFFLSFSSWHPSFLSTFAIFMKNNFFVPYTGIIPLLTIIQSLSPKSYFESFNKSLHFHFLFTTSRKIYFLTLLSIYLINSSCSLAICFRCSLPFLTGSFGNSEHFQFALRDHHPGKDGGAELYGHTRYCKSTDTGSHGTFYWETEKGLAGPHWLAYPKHNKGHMK